MTFLSNERLFSRKISEVALAIIIKFRLSKDEILEATRAQISFAPVFLGIPIILTAQDAMALPTFHGRKDLVALPGNVPLDAIGSREYSYSR
jgi:hypothetical protein